MPADDEQQYSEQFFPIDITTIRNSAPIQSHLSKSNASSLKRLRISPNWYPSFPKDRIHNFAKVSGQQPQRTKKTDVRTFQESLPESGIRLGGRLDRTCGKIIARYALIAYCILSCIIAAYRVYAFIFVKTYTPQQHPRPQLVQLPTMEMSVMTGYLLKALPCCTTFEPFVLSSDHKDSEVSFVGWLNESAIDSIRTWSTRWPGRFFYLNSWVCILTVVLKGRFRFSLRLPHFKVLPPIANC